MQEQSRVMQASSLSTTDNKAINDLVTALKENSYDYTSHIKLVELLTKGLRDHVTPPDAPDATRDPQSYELLAELRRARQHMQAKFAIGEDAWIAWINDEKMLARSTDDRLSLMELCLKSVQEEPSSSTLWRMYGDYMHWLWAAAFDVEPAGWSDEDKIVGREVFSWQAMIDVWEQGLPATQWHMNDSHLVWDRWMEIMLRDQDARPDPQKLHKLRTDFTDRLTKPHATWDNTFQMFSGFVSKYFNAEYEETMLNTTKRASQAKQQFALREQYELKVDRAVKAGDKDVEWEAYSQYLEWEVRNKGVFSFHLINALYERATLRFSIDATVWQDYVQVLMEHPNSGVEVLPVLERGSRHCPWSGELWSHRLLTLEAEGRSFDEMESVKHSATETGLLDVGGLEELLKVYIAWCGFLRRKAFDGRSSEDDIDIAEVGIRSALEHVKEIGEKNYGKEFKGDPQYRLERINIKFITQSGNIQAARDCWKALIPRQENSYDFWYRYYIWEMVIWSKWAMRDKENAGQTLAAPRGATNLLRQALKTVMTMDWPEQLVDMFINHCEQHETVHEYRYAIVESRKARLEVAARRQREAAEAAAAYQQQMASALEATPAVYEDPNANGKRKRDLDFASEESAAKKSRQVEEMGAEPMEVEASSSAEAQQKRDRENTTVIAKNIPVAVSQTKVRQFFRDCGKINSIDIVADPDGSTQAATIEFESTQDAQFAVSRDGKSIDGNTIQVSLGTGSTLWVTNYPPEADEAYIRKLFRDYGEIVSVRFPSLKFNTHRRFCYVTFLNGQQAASASKALDSMALEKGHRLRALVSDPNNKDPRHGAMHEGREVFVGNIEMMASDENIQEFVSRFEGFQKVRVPRNMNGRGKGIAFVEFDTPENAKNAAEGLDMKEFQKRILRANIAQPKGGKRHATTLLGQASASPEPGSTPGQDDAASTNGVQAGISDRHERTIALMDIPDTVNDARIRAAAETYGTLKKIVLMPEHQGAIVEFATVSDMGKASLGLDGHEIAPGRKMRVGSVAEMKRMRAEEKVDRLGAGGPAGKKKDDSKKTSGPALMQQAPKISRPGQQGGRRGGKGGLGVKRSGGPAATKDVDMGGEASSAKSNADFKAMFLASKEKGKDEGAEKDGGDDAGNA